MADEVHVAKPEIKPAAAPTSDYNPIEPTPEIQTKLNSMSDTIASLIETSRPWRSNKPESAGDPLVTCYFKYPAQTVIGKDKDNKDITMATFINNALAEHKKYGRWCRQNLTNSLGASQNARMYKYVEASNEMYGSFKEAQPTTARALESTGFKITEKTEIVVPLVEAIPNLSAML